MWNESGAGVDAFARVVALARSQYVPLSYLVFLTGDEFFIQGEGCLAR